MAGMAAIWAGRVGSMDGTDWAWVMAAIEKRATARVYRIAFVNIGSILRVGRQLRRSRQFGRQLKRVSEDLPHLAFCLYFTLSMNAPRTLPKRILRGTF